MVDRNLPLEKHMVYPYLPFQKGTPLQVVRWAGERVSVLITASSLSLTLPSTTLLELSATENCYIIFGTGAPTATSTIANDGSRLFMAGVQIVPVPIDPGTDVPYTHMAVIRTDTNGIFQAESVL